MPFKLNPITGRLDMTGSPSGESAEFVKEFTSATEVVVDHNLGDREPDVNITNLSGQKIYGNIDFVSPNQLIVGFSWETSGKIKCRA
ncbi:MAG: hypothetical protein KA053_08955 [Lentimicrobiaceae bacterium]|nr:hypothetical protein [Lentimicrobiaceae bacterium]